jgi:phage-related holin
MILRSLLNEVASKNLFSNNSKIQIPTKLGILVALEICDILISGSLVSDCAFCFYVGKKELIPLNS